MDPVSMVRGEAGASTASDVDGASEAIREAAMSGVDPG